MIHVLKIATVLILCSSLNAIMATQDSGLSKATNKTDVPNILITREGNGEGRQLISAVWEDGTVLFRSVVNDVRAPLLVGELEPASVQAAMTRIVDLGFEKSTPPGNPPDAEIITIQTHRGTPVTTTKRQWDEHVVFLVFEKRTNQEKIKFMEMWFAIRGTLTSLLPHNAKRLEDSLDASGQFRGYGLKNPSQTRWMN